MTNDTERRAVRAFYRQRRLTLDLPAQVVAARAGIHVTAYSQIENGWRVPTAEQAKTLARILKVKTAELPAQRRAA
jgi:transcriptional regulator with XRE-family HTH domain